MSDGFDIEVDMDALWDETFGELEQSNDQSNNETNNQTDQQPSQTIEVKDEADQTIDKTTTSEKPAKTKGKPGRRKGSKNGTSQKQSNPFLSDSATPSKSPNHAQSQSKRRRDASRREKQRKEEEYRHEQSKRNLSESGQIRYDIFRKSSLNSKSLKLLVQQVTGSHKVPTSMPILLGAVGKSFVCELIEKCRYIMQSNGHSGPIQVMHIREAVREMDYEGRRAPDAIKQERAPFTKTRRVPRLLRR